MIAVPSLRETALRDFAGMRVQHLGLVGYEPAWRAMQKLTSERHAGTPDEIWVLQHPPVYTLGIAGRPQHLPRLDNGVPVVRTDRGGQITYHGPGQLVAYLLLDMRRRHLNVRSLVRRMEQAVIDLLAEHGVAAHGREDAPGVYVAAAKIAALGLRIRGGCCYHGIALNVDMDLAPFRAIDPCGYPGLDVTQMRDLGITDTVERVGGRVVQSLIRNLQ
ncbi:MAG: lipoyl(octanoyl) transferase LipB [Betaproteobacteria bacterium]